MLYYDANFYLFVNVVEIYKFKAKISKVNGARSCLGNVSKNVQADNMKKTGWYGCVYDFSVDYDSIDVADILDVH